MIAFAAVILAIVALIAAPADGSAAEPPLTVAPAKLSAALQCYGHIGPAAKTPIVFAPGTGSDGSQVHALGGPAFDRIGRPYCAVSFPDRTTADVQVSVQYLVSAIRTTSRRAGRPIAVAGVSQGGLLARLALTAWPSLRSRVSDVVSVSGTQHGATRSPLCATQGCPPAFWQQARGSDLLRALNDGRDETPGRDTAWTTIRSSTDEIVRPQTGTHPTSALRGAANILIQDVCPGRTTTHLGTVVDSVTLAALRDAVTHPGPARASRLPADVCSHPYGDGLDETQTARFLEIAPTMVGKGMAGVPVVRAEPRVRSWVMAAGSTRAAPAARTAATASQLATVPFTDSYRGYNIFDSGTSSPDKCTGTQPVYGSEPVAAGRYPVVIYLHGTDADWSGNAEGKAIAALAASEGFVAAAFTYDSWLTGWWTPYMDAHARCMFSAGSPGNALARLCARPKADCSRGVVVSGFSQGGVIAALARNYSPLVRAAWLIGVNGPVEPALLAAPAGGRVLPDNRLRITVGRADADSLGPLNQLTGQSCSTSPCLRSDGSGFYVVQHAQVADGFADHCYWQSVNAAWPYWSCVSPPTFDPGFRPPSTLPWSLTANLDWLRTTLG